MGVFRIVFRACSPIQIGAGALGMIERTAMIVPGRRIWGALTASLVRSLFPSPRSEFYEEAGTELKKGRFSTFFPCLPVKENDSTLHRMIPCLPEHTFVAEDQPGLALDQDEVESLLCGSSASTALDPARMAAAEGSLHSTDLILPVWSIGCGKRKKQATTFSGYLELPERIRAGGADIPMDAPRVRECFSCMRIGGGRRNGWGVIAPLSVETVSSYDGFESIPWKSGRLLTAEFPIASDGHKVHGRARLRSCREYDPARGSGQRFTAARMVWQTGSVVYD